MSQLASDAGASVDAASEGQSSSNPALLDANVNEFLGSRPAPCLSSARAPRFALLSTWTGRAPAFPHQVAPPSGLSSPQGDRSSTMPVRDPPGRDLREVARGARWAECRRALAPERRLNPMAAMSSGLSSFSWTSSLPNFAASARAPCRSFSTDHGAWCASACGRTYPGDPRARHEPWCGCWTMPRTWPRRWLTRMTSGGRRSHGSGLDRACCRRLPQTPRSPTSVPIAEVVRLTACASSGPCHPSVAAAAQERDAYCSRLRVSPMCRAVRETLYADTPRIGEHFPQRHGQIR